MRSIVTCSLVLAALLAGAPAARAETIWMEVGDAGQLPATAQVPMVPGALTGISGTITNAGDADMYLINITNPAAFSATTVGQPGTLFDTQLFLFRTTGFGIEANDNVSLMPLNLRSTLPAGGPLAPTTPGLYLLAISAFDNDPVAPGGLQIFPDPPGGVGVVGPTGPGGGLAITGWTGTGNTTGTYQIALTGVGGGDGAIPEPSSVVLLGLGAVAALGYCIRRRRAA